MRTLIILELKKNNTASIGTVAVGLFNLTFSMKIEEAHLGLLH